ncbi:MAG: ATP-binding cassette domain-containing protein, partial [Gammaproteobacteria bacterium]
SSRHAALNDVNLTVRAGEILGIAGVGGNGQTELAEAIFGLMRPTAGSISVDGVTLDDAPVRARRGCGLRLIPADRFEYALLAELRAYENLALPGVPGGSFGTLAYLDRGAMRSHAGAIFDARQIVGGKPGTRTRLLSGGNAQKLLLARELNEAVGVLVAHSPTRGLDVRACQAVHGALVRQVQEGAACLLISEDLDEVLQLSTQVAVMSRGRLEGPFERKQVERAHIGEMMAGHA